MSRNYMLLLLLALALALAAAGCSSRDETSQELSPAQQPELQRTGPGSLNLPLPSALAGRQASAPEDEQRDGAQFDPALTPSRVTAEGTIGRFDPVWDGAIPQLGTAAYALYRFDLSTFAGTAKLNTYWQSAPDDGTLWLGFGNFDTDSWDWRASDADGTALPDLAPYMAPDGTVLVLVLLTDDTLALLTALQFGDAAAPVASLFANPTNGSAPLSTSLNASGSSDPDGSIVNVEWDLDANSSFETTTGTTLDMFHTFDFPRGNYPVSVRVTDNDGLSDIATVMLNFDPATYVEPADEDFVDNSDAGDSNGEKWLKNCYAPLPEWRDPNRAFQNAYFTEQADEVLRLVNDARAANLPPLPPLMRDPHLELLSQAHSRHMGLFGLHFHQHPALYNLDPNQRFLLIDPPVWVQTAENIAVGYPTAAEVMDGWMNSAGHRANILDPGLTHIGIGVFVHREPGFDADANPDTVDWGIYWCQTFATLIAPEGNDWLDPHEVN